MRNRIQVVVGGIFILLGLLTLISTVFHIDFGAFCFPVLLILLGIWFIWRPRLERQSKHVTIRLLGNVRRLDRWSVTPEEFWLGIGDVILDFVQADIPAGENALQIYALIGDVTLYIPADVGLSISAANLIGNTNLMGNRETQILAPVDYTTPDYAASSRKIRLDIWCLIGDIKVRQVPAQTTGAQVYP